VNVYTQTMPKISEVCSQTVSPQGSVSVQSGPAISEGRQSQAWLLDVSRGQTVTYKHSVQRLRQSTQPKTVSRSQGTIPKFVSVRSAVARYGVSHSQSRNPFVSA
jgi:hypothetical protein